MCRRRFPFPRGIVAIVLAALAVSILCLIPSMALAQASPTVTTGTDPTLGTMLTDGNGLSLYARAGDTSTNVTCTGTCLTNWPPLLTTGTPSLAPGVAGVLGTVTLGDGTRQVTYNNMPLYYWAHDANPGDVLGQGIGGFSVVAPVAVTGK